MRISIGIPSYNEEANITMLLNAISKQITDHEIIEVIISDDSTDRTPHLVSKYKEVRLLHHNIRRGAGEAWNEIFSEAKGDVIVLYDADVIPAKQTTDLLASAINDEVALCAGNPVPVKGSGLASRASIFNSRWLRNIRRSCISKYTVMGRALSIRGDVAKQITIPDIIAIDLFLQCKVMEMGYKVTYLDDARVWFKPPNTIYDHLSQVRRAMKGHKEIDNYVKKLSLDPSLRILIKESINSIISDPAGAMVSALAYLYPYKEEEQAKWKIAYSTKSFNDEIYKVAE